MARRPARGVAQRLRDRIYDSIRDLVERGKLQPGQRLTESHLAARFGASRTPVREALFQLAREGLLEPLERGYGLREMPMSAILERLDVKYRLDPVMIARVVEAGSTAQIKHLAALANEARSMLASDQSPFTLASAVHTFQKAFGGMCANSVLARCYAVAEDDFLAARPLLLRSARNRLITVDYLEALVPDMEAGDAPAAESETRAFISKLANSCQETARPVTVRPLTGTQGEVSVNRVHDSALTAVRPGELGRS